MTGLDESDRMPVVIFSLVYLLVRRLFELLVRRSCSNASKCGLCWGDSGTQRRTLLSMRNRKGEQPENGPALVRGRTVP